MTAQRTTDLRCEYYEQQGILAEEQGQSVAHHVDGCRECQRRQAQINRLRRTLTLLPDLVSDSNWEQGIWAKIAARAERRAARRRLIRLVIPVAAAAAAIITLFVMRPDSRPPLPAAPGLVLASRTERPPGPIVRSGGASVGDFWVLEAGGLGSQAAELRIYQLDSGLVLRCTTTPPCQREGDLLRVRWRLPALGTYRAVILSGPDPLPAPTGSMDDDIATLRRAGVDWRDVEQPVY